MASSDVNPASPEASKSSCRRKACRSSNGSGSKRQNHCDEPLVAYFPGNCFPYANCHKEEAARLAASSRTITARQRCFTNGDDGPTHSDGLDPIRSDDLGP